MILILLCYMSNVISEMLLKDIFIYVHCCMIYYQMKGQPISTLLTIIMLNTNKGFVVSHGSRILTLAQVFVLISWYESWLSRQECNKSQSDCAVKVVRNRVQEMNNRQGGAAPTKEENDFFLVENLSTVTKPANALTVIALAGFISLQLPLRQTLIATSIDYTASF